MGEIMAKKFNRRKRNYLINKDLQGKLSLKYLLLTLSGLLVLGGLFVLTTHDYLTISYDNDIQVGSAPAIMMTDLLKNGGFFLVIGGFILIVLTIVWTHKIAGPLYRFEKTLEAMNAYDLSQQIYLRKGDEGKSLSNEINAFNLSLGRELQELKEICQTLHESEEKEQIIKILNKYKLPE